MFLTIDKYSTIEDLNEEIKESFLHDAYYSAMNVRLLGLSDYQIFLPKNEQETISYVSKNIGDLEYNPKQIMIIYKLTYINSLLSYNPFRKTTIFILTNHEDKVEEFFSKREYIF